MTPPAKSDRGLVRMALLYCGLFQIVTDVFGTIVPAVRALIGEKSDPWFEEQVNAGYGTDTGCYRPLLAERTNAGL